jgi:hypothetical protein
MPSGSRGGGRFSAEIYQCIQKGELNMSTDKDHERSLQSEGIKVFDPRDGEMKVSGNPALILRDLITRHNTLRLDRKDENTIIDLANYCDENVYILNIVL